MSVIVGEPGVTFYCHKQVLAISPILERMCETETAKETSTITLPEDHPGILEHILGYLYFRKFNLPSPDLLRWDAGWDEPDRLQTHRSANDIIMNTYVIADKYGVDNLKPLLLESLQLRNSTEELYRSAKIVYDADADDAVFRNFFKKDLMMKLEHAFNLDDPYLSLSKLDNLAAWGFSGGRLSADLAWALANKIREKEEANKKIEINKASGCPNKTDFQCGWVGCEGNEPAQSYQDALHNISGWNDDFEASRENRDINTDIEEPWKESEVDRPSTKGRELTDKMNRLSTQLELPNKQGKSHSEGPLPRSISHTLYPLTHNAAVSQGRTAIALQASSGWDSTLNFPAGAIITNVVSNSATTWLHQLKNCRTPILAFSTADAMRGILASSQADMCI